MAAVYQSSSNNNDLKISVVDPRLLRDDDAACSSNVLQILVEPLYGCVAVAAALDAGWESVELAPLLDEVAPIALVSFEQSPAADAIRCRVRSTDLKADAKVGMLLASPTLARPLASKIAFSQDISEIIFVPSLAGNPRSMAADSWWACGMLIRVLLEELDAQVPVLDDSAGVAVTLAQGAEDVFSQLSSGVRWKNHLAIGGNEDDLRVASAVDAYGVIPVVDQDKDQLIARAWML